MSTCSDRTERDRELDDYSSRSEMSPKDSEKEKLHKGPRDRFYLVYITFYLIGVSSLLPWNFFITANGYWMYKFRNISSDESSIEDKESKTTLQAQFTSYLVLASMLPFVISLLVNALISSRVSPKIRIAFPLTLAATLFTVTSILVYVDTDYHQTAFFGGTLAIASVINSSVAFLQGGGSGIASCLPKEYMKAYMNGQAIGGILASVAQILSLVFESSALKSALAYFLCAVLILVITLIAFLVTLRTDFYKCYTSIQKIDEKFGHQSMKELIMPFVDILKMMWPYAIAILFTFMVTLAIFPAVLVTVVSTTNVKNIWSDALFIPVTCFLLFNVGDLAGRLVGGFLTLPIKKKYLLIPFCCLHAVFIVLFVFCNLHPRTPNLPVAFKSDVYYITFVTLFAVSNGHLCSTSFINAPKTVQPEQQQTAGSMMAAFQGIGLTLGSVLSLGIVKLLQGNTAES